MKKVTKSIKKILLIFRTSSEIEPNQVEKTIIYIKPRGKQRQTTKLEDIDDMKHQSLKSSSIEHGRLQPN